VILVITHTHSRADVNRTAVTMAALAASLNFIPDRSSRARPFLQSDGCDGSRRTPMRIKRVAMQAAVALAGLGRPRSVGAAMCPCDAHLHGLSLRQDVSR
jgi:hypothetical protein